MFVDVGGRGRRWLIGVVTALSFSFVSSVLEPYFHLGLSEFESFGQFIAIRPREVSLLHEPAFQLINLGGGRKEKKVEFEREGGGSTSIMKVGVFGWDWRSFLFVYEQHNFYYQ